MSPESAQFYIKGGIRWLPICFSAQNSCLRRISNTMTHNIQTLIVIVGIFSCRPILGKIRRSLNPWGNLMYTSKYVGGRGHLIPCLPAQHEWEHVRLSPTDWLSWCKVQWLNYQLCLYVHQWIFNAWYWTPPAAFNFWGISSVNTKTRKEKKSKLMYEDILQRFSSITEFYLWGIQEKF